MLEGKRIWVDLEHQKAAVMLAPLVTRLRADGAGLLVTARDMGNNRQILDEIGIEYTMIGRHGGATLDGKMTAYSDRIGALLPLVTGFKPDVLVTFSSVEAIRIAFGLKIPAVSFNDEPRSTAVGRLTLPIAGRVIVPRCVPVKQYLALGAPRDHIVRYDGIDEMAWIYRYHPDPAVLGTMGVETGRYAVIRTEMTHAEYLSGSMPPERSAVADFLPRVAKAFPSYKFFVIPRLEAQFNHVQRVFAGMENVIVTRFVPNIQDLMFYSAFVASGGGTIAREAALMGVPTIEFFPGDTAPQERWLKRHGFPIWHVRDPSAVAAKAIAILSRGTGTRGFKLRYEDPIETCCREIACLLERGMFLTEYCELCGMYMYGDGTLVDIGRGIMVWACKSCKNHAKT